MPSGLAAPVAQVAPRLAAAHAMLTIEVEREEDGRWIGEVPALPGVLAYGATAAEARTKVSRRGA